MKQLLVTLLLLSSLAPRVWAEEPPRAGLKEEPKEPPRVSTGERIEIPDAGFSVIPPNGWMVNKNSHGSSLMFEAPKQPNQNYQPTIQVMVFSKLRYIDEVTQKEYGDLIVEKFGKLSNRVTSYRLRSAEILQMETGDPAILYYTEFQYDDVPIMQMHILISSATNHFLMSYTDIARVFEDESSPGLAIAYTSMHSAQVSTQPPWRWRGFAIAGVALFAVIFAWFTMRTLRARKMSRLGQRIEDEDNKEITQDEESHYYSRHSPVSEAHGDEDDDWSESKPAAKGKSTPAKKPADKSSQIQSSHFDDDYDDEDGPAVSEVVPISTLEKSLHPGRKRKPEHAAPRQPAQPTSVPPVQPAAPAPMQQPVMNAPMPPPAMAQAVPPQAMPQQSIQQQAPQMMPPVAQPAMAQQPVQHPAPQMMPPVAQPAMPQQPMQHQAPQMMPPVVQPAMPQPSMPQQAQQMPASYPTAPQAAPVPAPHQQAMPMQQPGVPPYQQPMPASPVQHAAPAYQPPMPEPVSAQPSHQTPAFEAMAHAAQFGQNQHTNPSFVPNQAPAPVSAQPSFIPQANTMQSAPASGYQQAAAAPAPVAQAYAPPPQPAPAPSMPQFAPAVEAVEQPVTASRQPLSTARNQSQPRSMELDDDDAPEMTEEARLSEILPKAGTIEKSKPKRKGLFWRKKTDDDDHDEEQDEGGEDNKGSWQMEATKKSSMRGKGKADSDDDNDSGDQWAVEPTKKSSLSRVVEKDEDEPEESEAWAPEATKRSDPKKDSLLNETQGPQRLVGRTPQPPVAKENNAAVTEDGWNLNQQVASDDDEEDDEEVG